MKRKALFFILFIIAILVIGEIVIFLRRPRVILKMENFRHTLQEGLIIPDGTAVLFVTKANFTITNIGNNDSNPFIIFVHTGKVQYSVPVDPIVVEPLKVGETRVIELEGFSGVGFPDLTLGYAGEAYDFPFGGSTTIEIT